MKLELKDVVKVYDKKVLDNICCTFESGVYGLLGPNGAGKSTLIRLMCHLENPAGGEILLDGEPITKLDAKYRSILGYAPQKAGYYPDFTATEFLDYMCIVKGVPKCEIKAQTEKMLSLVNLSDTRSTKIRKFSGGMVQRLNIAQALLNNPDILILDEPTVGLDLEERMKFKQFIAEYAENRIVILATHIVSDIEDIGNEIIVLNTGKIIKSSTPGDLLEAIKGKVWALTCTKEEAIALRKRFRVSNIRTKENLTEVRLIADTQPTGNAVLSEGNLQDVYLSLLECA